ncbi:molybdenum cofactor guanylyltransferase [Paenibacillus aestuarii]|uniref:Probable molybdenum cofactor guanylyltransferase n=2 Tax=Paenibacillus aestuarii TaxID=516965 RepID=A0ABW0KDL3_9BACL
MTGVILAGGMNRRMGGRLKALLPVQGKPLIVRQLEEMAICCPEILVVTNAQDALQPYLDSVKAANVRCIGDQFTGTGPLGGIHAAAQAAGEALMWVVGCDMPYISSAAAVAMERIVKARNCEAAIPALEGRLHPLHGLYTRVIGAKAETLLASGQYRLMGLLEQLDWSELDAPFFAQYGIGTNFAANMNTPEQYKELLGFCQEI